MGSLVWAEVKPSKQERAIPIGEKIVDMTRLTACNALYLLFFKTAEFFPWCTWITCQRSKISTKIRITSWSGNKIVLILSQRYEHAGIGYFILILKESHHSSFELKHWNIFFFFLYHTFVVLTASDPASTMSPGWDLQPGSISLCLYAENTSSLKNTKHPIRLQKLLAKQECSLFICSFNTNCKKV